MKSLPLIAAVILATALSAFLVLREPAPETPDPPGDTPPDSTSSSAPSSSTSHPYYSEGEKTFDGTGKYYQGREIAYVMGHQAIPWLERNDREAEEAPSRAISLIDLAKGETLADIGAGSGYYATRIALKFPKAEVIGVDIQPEMVSFLKRRATQLDLDNLTTNLGTIEDIKLPPESIDAALMVDAYHEFSHPYEMMTSVVSALKPGGRLYLLEYRAEDQSVPIKPLHKMSQAQSIKEMKLVGLIWEKTLDQLPWQHFMIFRKP